MKTNNMLILIITALVIGLFIGFSVKDLPQFSGNVLSTSDAQTKVEEYFSRSGITGVTVKEVTADDNKALYQVSLEYQGQLLTSYMTKDGSKLFQSAISLDQAAVSDTPQQEPPQELVKADKPNVELFVMSHCPYGTQIEKGILPVVDTLGDSIDFELKFVDYAMHGEVELKEQMNQYCVQAEQPAKFNAYLSCFLESGEGDACLASTGVNKTTMNTCVSKIDQEHEILSMFNDKSTWVNGQFPQFNISKDDNDKYGVQGSPTLVINGAQVSSARDASSLLATVCGSFNEQPEACDTELSSATPAPGFGTGTTAGSTDASCE